MNFSTNLLILGIGCSHSVVHLVEGHSSVFNQRKNVEMGDSCSIIIVISPEVVFPCFFIELTELEEGF